MSSIKLFVCNKVTRQPQENAPPESLQRAHSYFCDNDCQGKINVTSQPQLPEAPWNAASELADIYEPTGSHRRNTADFPSSACEEVVFPKFYIQWNIPDQRSASASTGTNTRDQCISWVWQRSGSLSTCTQSPGKLHCREALGQPWEKTEQERLRSTTEVFSTCELMWFSRSCRQSYTVLSQPTKKVLLTSLPNIVLKTSNKKAEIAPWCDPCRRCKIQGG